MKCNFCDNHLNIALSFQSFFSKTPKLCKDCQEKLQLKSSHIDKYNLYYFAHYEAIKEDIYAIKYFKQVNKAEQFKILFDTFFKDKNFDLISIAPTNITRTAIRGFNPVEIICRINHINYEKLFIERYRPKQATLKEARQFSHISVIKEKEDFIKQAKTILIIDDITTSGKTLISIANSLEKINKGLEISFLTLAKT